MQKQGEKEVVVFFFFLFDSEKRFSTPVSLPLSQFAIGARSGSVPSWMLALQT